MRLTPSGSPVLSRSAQGGSPASRGSPNLTPKKREDGTRLAVANLHRGKLIGKHPCQIHISYSTVLVGVCSMQYTCPVLCDAGTSSFGYSVYVGLDSSGELVALYEWTLHCRPAKRGHADLGMAAARRVKQVGQAWTSGSRVWGVSEGVGFKVWGVSKGCVLVWGVRGCEV